MLAPTSALPNYVRIARIADEPLAFADRALLCSTTPTVAPSWGQSFYDALDGRGRHGLLQPSLTAAEAAITPRPRSLPGGSRIPNSA